MSVGLCEHLSLSSREETGDKIRGEKPQLAEMW